MMLEPSPVGCEVNEEVVGQAVDLFPEGILADFRATSKDMVLGSSLLYQAKYRQWGPSQDISNRRVRSREIDCLKD